jgi:secreted trypsin-like serine protease
MGKWKWVALAAVTAAAALAGSAFAITYGRPDGGAHPNVGALIAQSSSGLKLYCSGSLVAPKVFLTAAHCTAPALEHGVTDAYVTFDEHADPATSKLLHGVIRSNPLFNRTQSDPEDLAVIVLDAPARGVTPAALPSLGLLDALAAKNGLKSAAFSVVGYGLHEPGVAWDASRWQAVSGYNSSPGTWLHLTQNPSLGYGGTCTGDSGGPVFLGGVEVAVTVSGDPMCKSTSDDYRLDTPQARAFLGQFVALP